MKQFIVSLIGLVCPCLCGAARYIGLDYTTEMQTDFKGGANWVNLLRTSLSFPLARKLTLEAATVSVSETRTEPLLPDLQTFSNIEEADMPLAFALLGVQWEWGKSSCFIGIRNLNEDYFNSPCTSLFTNSSCGIVPTLSFNFPLPNYPVAAVGLDYKWTDERWLVEFSLYNGTARSRFTGRENVFRFCPSTDGILGITSVSYRQHESSYYLGSALYSRMSVGDAERSEEPTQPAEKREVNWVSWAYAEQRLGDSGLWLLLHASVAPQVSAGCRTFAGAGLVAHCGKTEGGCFADYARFTGSYEWTAELTWKIPCLKNGYVQPALHVICNPDLRAAAGLLRFGYAW